MKIVEDDVDVCVFSTMTREIIMMMMMYTVAGEDEDAVNGRFYLHGSQEHS